MSKDTAFNGETMFAPWRSQNPLRITGSASHYSHHTRQNEELLVKVSGSPPLVTLHVISTRFSKYETDRLQGFHSIRTKRLKKQKKKRTLWILVPDHTEPTSFYSVSNILACRCFSVESQKTSDLVSNSMSV